MTPNLPETDDELLMRMRNGDEQAFVAIYRRRQAAIYRFARPVCFQNFPQALLPEELQDANPLQIVRLLDGKPEPQSSPLA